MMTTLAPFIKWGQYKSQDLNNTDVLELKVSSLETFDTSYSINVEVLQKVNGNWEEAILSLKSHESKNSSLLNQWNRAVVQGKIKEGKTIKLETWLGESRNGRTIRRFSLEF